MKQPYNHNTLGVTVQFIIITKSHEEIKKDRDVTLCLFAWQRPTLTGTCVPTTIGAEKLNFRVRYGNGCDLLAVATRLFYLRFYSLKTR